MPEKIIKRGEQLNPRITDVVIGIRDMRTIKIYPLSFHDQMETTDIITTGLVEFFEKGDEVKQAEILETSEDQQDINFVTFIIELIKDNIGRILGLATGEDGSKLLKEMDNVQVTEVVEIIFEKNFGDSGKNVASLIEKVQSLFLSMRSSQPSLNDIVDTDSRTFTEKVSETEDLPLDK